MKAFSPSQRVLLAMAIGLLVSLAWAAPAAACPGCSEALPNTTTQGDQSPDQPRAAVAEGYAWSILLMLGVPMVLLSVMGVGFVYLFRKADANADLIAAAAQRRQQATAARNDSVDPPDAG